jgi:hypothetical protein
MIQSSVARQFQIPQTSRIDIDSTGITRIRVYFMRDLSESTTDLSHDRCGSTTFNHFFFLSTAIGTRYLSQRKYPAHGVLQSTIFSILWCPACVKVERGPILCCSGTRCSYSGSQRVGDDIRSKRCTDASRCCTVYSTYCKSSYIMIANSE